MSSGFVGIDVGSISTNIVAIGPDRDVLFELYGRGEGSPIVSVQKGLAQLAQELSPSFEVKGLCVTGSGRSLIGNIVGANVIKNEITAHGRAAVYLHPEVQTIFEIGGQDSKVTVVRDGVVVDFAMNLVCAAGTGSFLDSQAKRLGITVQQLGERAQGSESPTSIAGRCTVFAESDMIHKQQCGHSQQDILMGLCHAMVRNYLSNVCKGKEIKPPILFQGGVSQNRGIRRAFGEALGCEIVVPKHNTVMGALGAAIIASESAIDRSTFRGFGLSEQEIKTRSFLCEDCSNNCEIVEILTSGESIGKSGGRCGKWEGGVDPTGPRGGANVRPACRPADCLDPPQEPERRAGFWSVLRPWR